MNEIIASPGITQARISRLLKYTAQAMILLPLIAAFFVYRAWTVQPAAPAQTESQSIPTTLSAQAFEERFGVRIAMIGVTGGGGIVDFRYKILDKKKAEFLFGGEHTMPTLVVEDSGVSLIPPKHTMKHNFRMDTGKTYYTFYPNTQNAVRPGSRVAVVVGAVRLEPIIAQ